MFIELVLHVLLVKNGLSLAVTIGVDMVIVLELKVFLDLVLYVLLVKSGLSSFHQVKSTVGLSSFHLVCQFPVTKIVSACTREKIRILSKKRKDRTLLVRLEKIVRVNKK